jgi:branched-chain amino acid transport system substrate-binding protein
MTFSPDPRKNEAAQPVVEEFQAQGYDPEGYTLYTYATIQVWADAVEKAGTTDLDAVLEQLNSNTFETVLGSVTFDENGDVTGDNYVLFEWDNGQYHELGS